MLLLIIEIFCSDAWSENYSGKTLFFQISPMWAPAQCQICVPVKLLTSKSVSLRNAHSLFMYINNQ